MSFYKWKPSETAKKEFAEQMNAIDIFCQLHNISASASKDSYYFTINNQAYRVSNHSVEASNINSKGAYHNEGRREDTIYIHASKTRLIDIYKDIEAGYKLDGRGYRKN